MIITKQCYDCGEDFSIPEAEVFDGLVARPVENDSTDQQYIKIWLCEGCRRDAEDGGVLYEEDIDIIDDFDEEEGDLDP